VIGRRLGEMHEVLAHETSDQAFASEIADAEVCAEWARKTEQRLERAFDAINQTDHWDHAQERDRTKALLSLRQRIVAAARRLAKSGAGTAMTRIHGDFHLGQVLVASGDAYIIDFEGEPAASIAERRAKTSPLRDVAGLLRSIDYAGASLIDRKSVGAVPIDDAQRDQLIAEFRTRASSAFLRDYWAARGASGNSAERALLDLFLIEKAAYEIVYEAANRPTWIGVPLAGLSALATRIVGKEPGGRNG
jgi:maltose alpha-D-glucosyltransferase/alpha-amylase